MNATVDNQHYFKHVTQLGEQRSVVTTSPIYSSQGMKLVDSNVKVDSALYERLMAHRLSPQTIDSCLAAEDSVSVTTIRMRALNLLETNPSLALMHPLNERYHLLRVIDDLILNDPLAFRLTVMQSRQPALFDHSIAVMLIALFLGIRSNMPLQTLSSLATAAMLHDVGELHVDPSLLNRAHRLSSSERRQVYAHPLIGFLTLSPHSIYQGAICTAVLEHHERIDGSGYPHGLTGDRISVLGNVLALAELMAGLFDSNEASSAWQRLAIVLKLGQNRFRHQYLNHIGALLAIAPYAEVDHKSLDALQLAEPLILLAAVLADWRDTQHRSMDASLILPKSRLMDFIEQRLSNFMRELLRTGLMIDDPESLLDVISDDPVALAEVSNLVREAIRQIHDIIHEVRRRWDEFADAPAVVQDKLADWLDRSDVLLTPALH